MRRFVIIVAAIAGLSGPALAEDSDHLTELDGLRALHAWTRATDGAEALVFVEIENEGDAVVTLEGAAANGLTAELVGFRLIDGEPGHETIGSVPVSPGRSLHLEPDGLAIRLGGLPTPLTEGAVLDLDLRTSIGVVKIHVDVEAADATAHDHAGHNH
jgi:copper(I)-binding protein